MDMLAPSLQHQYQSMQLVIYQYATGMTDEKRKRHSRLQWLEMDIYENVKL